MAETVMAGGPPRLFTISAHHRFADSLVAGLRREAGDEPLALARSLVLLPNNRAVRAVTDAFVRASGGALLLPRLIALGDPDGGEAMEAAFDAADADDPPPAAIAPEVRRMILARLVADERARVGEPVGVAEAVRLAGELARTLDQLLVEEVEPERLRGLDMAAELSSHWQASLASLEVILDRWPEELARLGRIDMARRRALLLGRLGEQWRRDPPGLVCAAGITDTAPAVARLLRCVADLPHGSVVFAGLDRAMADAEWQALGPHAPDPATGLVARSIETHPQFALKLLLDRMSVARGEVADWPDRAGAAADEARGDAVADALAPAMFTGRWTELPSPERRLAGVTAAEFATPAEEAQGIALLLRGALEEPGRTAALVTPDRALARRVAVHCRRWGIAVDDSAGRPLSLAPPGTLLLALAEAAVEDFAPLALLTLLKHPLVRAGEARLAWLDGVRRLDLRLRGPRPLPGLVGIDGVVDGTGAAAWWSEARSLLEPVGAAFAAGEAPLAGLIACLREAAQALCGDALWSGPAGRAVATMIEELEAAAPAGPPLADPRDLPALLQTLLGEVAVRPPQGGHPRLAIYGQIEARLQSADLTVLGGLNEGTWPGTPAPDPWLAPRIRAALGLPGLERRIGVAAHDFAQGLGAPRAVLTRSRRDAAGPALASRFWLRLAAMAGQGFRRDAALERWAVMLDDPGEHSPVGRPAPAPSTRPTTIAVTEVDRLKADPFAFYARRHLRLAPLDPVDADPSPAWRGSEVHAVLQAWWEEDRCAVDALRPRALAMLGDARTHPIVRALWQPRLMEAIDWIATRVAADAENGRAVAFAEGKGKLAIAGVTLTGRYDRIDSLPDGGLVVIDYKTGKAPSATAVRAGYSMQLGLLGLIAERGGFEGVSGTARGFEYWSLAKDRDQFGKLSSPVDDAGARDRIVTAVFTAVAAATFVEAAGRWLTGDEPFTAKLVPDFATYADYDQLMRRDEWYGRE